MGLQQSVRLPVGSMMIKGRIERTRQPILGPHYLLCLSLVRRRPPGPYVAVEVVIFLVRRVSFDVPIHQNAFERFQSDQEAMVGNVDMIEVAPHN